MIEIILNGKAHSIAASSTILDLITTLKLQSKAMAIALNTQVVKKDAWASCVLSQGDCVEILDFVGGG